MKYQIFHTERNHTQGLMFGHVGFNDCRAEGVTDGYSSRDAAITAMREMQEQAIANGYQSYADSLHVERADYLGRIGGQY